MIEPTQVDGFYSDPAAVRALALSLEYGQAPATNYPGMRTGDLAMVAPALHAEFLAKFEALFGARGWEIQTMFQRIAGYANPAMNEGWVHSDGGELIAGVIYLNETALPGAGTSLCRTDVPGLSPNRNLQFRNDFYGGRNGVTEEAYLRARMLHNAKWQPFHTFENSFNRMVCYAAATPHKQDGFGRAGEDRLTQVFFATLKDRP